MKFKSIIWNKFCDFYPFYRGTANRLRWKTRRGTDKRRATPQILGVRPCETSLITLQRVSIFGYKQRFYKGHK